MDQNTSRGKEFMYVAIGTYFVTLTVRGIIKSVKTVKVLNALEGSTQEWTKAAKKAYDYIDADIIDQKFKNITEGLE